MTAAPLPSIPRWPERLKRLARPAARFGFLFAVGLLLCARLDPVRSPLIADNQVYYYISERAASGIPPHVSQFDPKNALSMLMTGAAIATGRALGVDDVMAARALSIGVTAAVAPILWAVTRAIGASPAMAWIAAWIPLVFHDYLVLAVVGARPKVFLVFFEALWMLAVARGGPFAVGLATGACFLVWQPALLLSVPALAWCLLREGSRVRGPALLAAGAIAPVLLYESYFLWHGALGDQLFQSLVFPASYGKDMRPLLTSTVNVLGLKDPPGPRVFLLCLFAASLAAAWLSAAFAPRRWWSGVRARPAPAAIVLGATAALAFCYVDYQGFPDRLLFLPFLAVVCGVVLGGALDRVSTLAAWPGNALGRARPAWVGLVAAVLAAGFLVHSVPERSFGRRGLPAQRILAARLARMADEGQSIYVMGPVHLLALERRSNFHRFGFFPVRVRAYISQRLREEGPLLPLAGGRLPDLVLESRQEFHATRRWLARYYRETVFDGFESAGFRMWRRERGAMPPPAARTY